MSLFTHLQVSVCLDNQSSMNRLKIHFLKHILSLLCLQFAYLPRGHTYCSLLWLLLARLVMVAEHLEHHATRCRSLVYTNIFMLWTKRNRFVRLLRGQQKEWSPAWIGCEITQQALHFLQQAYQISSRRESASEATGLRRNKRAPGRPMRAVICPRSLNTIRDMKSLKRTLRLEKGCTNTQF